MKTYRMKSSAKFQAVQWTELCSFEGVHKYCTAWLVKTAFGMLRLGLNNYVIKGPGNFKIVLDPSSFSEIFEEDI